MLDFGVDGVAELAEQALGDWLGDVSGVVAHAEDGAFEDEFEAGHCFCGCCCCYGFVGAVVDS